MATAHSEVVAVGIFGSYARGDSGVGSDLDLVVLVDRDIGPLERRCQVFAPRGMPVPTELLVYTVDEWRSMRESSPFVETISEQVRWLGTCASDDTGQNHYGRIGDD